MSQDVTAEPTEQEDDEYPPCTCTAECKASGKVCKGECGCRHHMMTYTDYLSGEFD